MGVVGERERERVDNGIKRTRQMGEGQISFKIDILLKKN